mmetsp:Transcript_8326/g.25027  ORF Transcript_8326/g.25027 Transcript_8326/m.25027 type:complete len:687 (-) Transcript_8326:148-2208(-)
MSSAAPRDPHDRAAYAIQVVLEYLKKRGYRGTEMELLPEPNKEANATFDDESRNVVMILDRATQGYENQPEMYEEMYKELRDWADGSLDLYKGELHSVLYPHLVHCFLEMVRRGATQAARRFLEKYGREFISHSEKRKEELTALMGVSTPEILQENETAKLFLNNRYELYLSAYALELLLAFLTDNSRRYLLLRILNHRCRVIDSTLSPSDKNLEEKTGFFASEEQAALLSKEVLWGTLKESEYVITDEQQEKENEKKKDKPEEEEEEVKPPHVEPDGTLSESPVPIPKYRQGAQGIDTLAPTFKGRVPLSRTNLPSCLFYTFANTRGCAMNCVTTSSDASIVAAGFQESSIRVWDYKSGQQNGTKLVGHSGPVFSVDLSLCGRYLLSGSEDGTVRLWSVQLKTDLVAYRGHNHPVWSVAWGPFGHYFASASHDSTARIWSTDRISPLRVLSGHLSDVDAVTWHPNNNYVATGSSDSTARLWDVRVGDCVRVFGTHPGPLHALAFSPNGRYLAMSGHTKDIHVWDIAECKQVQKMKGHEASVWHLAYSREGSVLASGSADNTIRVWDARSSAAEWKMSTAPPNTQPHPGASTATPAAPASAPKGSAAGAGGPTNKPSSAPTSTPANAMASLSSLSAAGPVMSQTTKSNESVEESALLVTLRTKKTPVYYVRFTNKNLLVASGAYGC